MGARRGHRLSKGPIRRAFQLSIHLLVLLSLLFGALGCSSGKQAAGARTIRVMTFNIHHGEGLDETVDIERIADLILDSKADIVALQEVDRGIERTGRIDIMTKLSDLTHMTYAFGKTADLQGGQLGNGFLTRFPIFEERNLLYAADSSGEQRGLLQLVLGVGSEELAVMSTKLDGRSTDTGRVVCVRELLAAAERYAPRPVIVCGDFSETAEGRATAIMKESFSDAWEAVGSGVGATWPADSPSVRVDYIFISRSYGKSDTTDRRTLRPITARVLSSRASDHLPLLVEFGFSTEK